MFSCSYCRHLLRIGSIWLLMASCFVGAADRIYDHVTVQDWTAPTLEEFFALQQYLTYGQRPLLYFVHEFNEEGIPVRDFRVQRARYFTMISAACPIIPKMERECFHCSPDTKDVCIVTYASLQGCYQECMELFRHSLRQQRFKGHLLFQIGGWPFIEGGGLKLCDIPYAFKVCAIKEAQRLGYKIVLWLDAALESKTSIMPLIRAIEKHKALFFKDELSFNFPSFKYMLSHDNHVTQALHTSWQEVESYTHLSAAMIGLDLTNQDVMKLLDEWYQVTAEGMACFSSVPEQLPLSILVHRHHMTQGIMSRQKLDQLFSIRPH